MQALFIILFLFSTELIQSVAVAQQSGFNPYPFGIPIICALYHPLLLITSIYYLGWFWGIVLFLAHLLNIIHVTVSWVLSVPALFLKGNRFLGYLRLQINLLSPLLLVNLAFAVASFFVTDYKSLFFALKSSTIPILTVIVSIAVLSVLRLVVHRYANKIKIPNSEQLSPGTTHVSTDSHLGVTPTLTHDIKEEARNEFDLRRVATRLYSQGKITDEEFDRMMDVVEHCEEEHYGRVLEPSSEEVYYMEARNGMTVRVPASKLDAWQAAQQKEGPVELTPQEQQLKERLLKRIYGE